ncbi:MAG: PAS domain-containing protein [Rhodospirillaceae bacterium]|nr:PAS domain-containing protein [Rhodospirillaceae bacterium]
MDQEPPDIGRDIRYLERHELSSAVIQGVLAFWDKQRGDGDLMAKDAVDPFALRPFLPYLTISEFHEDPFRLRYRLVGTEIVRFVRRDFTGIWLHESGWPDDVIALNLALYGHVHATRRPLFGLSTVEWDGRSSYRFEWAVLPLTADGRRVTHSLGIDDYSQIRTRPPIPLPPE